MSDPSPPPAPKNPVVTAYENFVRDTPLVSRYILSACGICYLLSFVINPQFSLANIPYFSVYKLEVYRILVAPLLCDNIVSLVFAYFVVTDHVKRLEFSLGSTAFGVLFMALNLLVNLSHIVVCLSLRLVLQNPSWALVPATGIWIVLLPLMATECLQSPGGASGGGGGVRKLFCWTVPAFYYPLILGALLGIMSGFLVPYALATAIGYAHGLQYLEPLTRRICPSEARCKQWEETVLSEFTTRQGFVPGHAAAGSAAWNDAAASASGGSGASSLFSGLTAGGANNASGAGSDVAMGSSEAFPSGSGRQLGGGGAAAAGPTRRAVGVDARTARLKALEGNHNKDGDEAV